MITFIKKLYSGSYNAHLFVGVIAMFGLYSFLVVSTIVSVNQRKDIRADIRTTQAKVSDLEISYFNLASQIDIHKAEALGFVNAAVPKFAYTGGNQEEKVALLR